MKIDDSFLTVRLAQSDAERRAAFRLRYRVFVQEMGGDGPSVDHLAGEERDAHDARCDHLLLIDGRRDPAQGGHVVGTYRLLRCEVLPQGAAFYSEREFDLSVLRASGRRLLELGRSCVDPRFRGGAAMLHLWSGLGDYVALHGCEILFGVASFPGTDVAALAQPLAQLQHAHLAPEALRPRARGGVAMDLPAPDQIDRRTAMLATPALIKAYLRMGGFVGEGVFVDTAFGCTDVCLVLDTSRMPAAPFPPMRAHA